MVHPSLPSIQSITTGPRQTNFELLRIFAMFLVVVVHSDFFSLSYPTDTDFADNPLSTFCRTLIESLSIVCVNVFVFISGWFGIRLSIKGITGFLFQCFYFIAGLYIVMLLSGKADLTLRALSECFLLTPSLWFVKAYLGLYILSPLLNVFAEKASRRQFKILLILFFTFQTVYGCTYSVNWIHSGYSTFSFIGLYLLASYMRTYDIPAISRHGGTIYLLAALVNSIYYYAKVNYNLPLDAFSYINPIVILGSIGLFTWFSKLKIKHSVTINYVAASVFAVYLFHQNTYIKPIFKSTVLDLYNSYSGVICIIIILLFDIGVFLLAILLDQPRKFIWKKLNCHLCTLVDKLCRKVCR